MAHFAELDDNNVVLRTVVVDDKDTMDENGNEVEAIGAAYLNNLLGGRWLKTSYNHKIRGQYAGQGMLYDEEADRFYHPAPFPSWVLDKSDWIFKAPVEMPAHDGTVRYKWDEPTLSWVLMKDDELI
jgi:hypothetical protein